MTITEFRDDITEWWELIDFCNDHEIDDLEDIVDSDTMDEIIDRDIRNSDLGWRSIRDYLGDINPNYDFYCHVNMFDFEPLDRSDFEYYKEDIIRNHADVFDYEDEETLHEEESEDASDDDFTSGIEEFTEDAILGMISATRKLYNTIKEERPVAEEFVNKIEDKIGYDPETGEIFEKNEEDEEAKWIESVTAEQNGDLFASIFQPANA